MILSPDFSPWMRNDGANFGVRDLAPALSPADSSAGDSPRRVAAGKSGDEPSHSKLALRDGLIWVYGLAMVVRTAEAGRDLPAVRLLGQAMGNAEGGRVALPESSASYGGRIRSEGLLNAGTGCR